MFGELDPKKVKQTKETLRRVHAKSPMQDYVKANPVLLQNPKVKKALAREKAYLRFMGDKGTFRENPARTDRMLNQMIKNEMSFSKIVKETFPKPKPKPKKMGRGGGGGIPSPTGLIGKAVEKFFKKV
jgi:hypothetical protein